MKESKESFRTKKVNSLNVSEILDLKSFLERCDQKDSKKYSQCVKENKGSKYLKV